MVNERLNVESSPTPGRGAWPTPQYESAASAGDFERIKGRDGAPFYEQKRRAITETPTCTPVTVDSLNGNPLPASPLAGRHTVWITNTHASTKVYVTDSTGANHGMTLEPGEKFPFFIDNDTVLIYVKAASGTAVVQVMELK